MKQVFRLAAVAVLLASGAAPAQQYPARPITLICPWPAGGGTDLHLRKIGELASKHLGQPVVIENRPGGSGMNGPSNMAKTAKPDGYTISQLAITAFRVPHMQKVDWDPIERLHLHHRRRRATPSASWSSPTRRSRPSRT